MAEERRQLGAGEGLVGLKPTFRKIRQISLVKHGLDEGIGPVGDGNIHQGEGLGGLGHPTRWGSGYRGGRGGNQWRGSSGSCYAR
jgi:hypothetical protein